MTERQRMLLMVKDRSEFDVFRRSSSGVTMATVQTLNEVALSLPGQLLQGRKHLHPYGCGRRLDYYCRYQIIAEIVAINWLSDSR